MTESIPGEFPGATVPEFATRPLMTPEPLRVVPAATVTFPLIVPLLVNIPELTNSEALIVAELLKVRLPAEVLLTELAVSWLAMTRFELVVVSKVIAYEPALRLPLIVAVVVPLPTVRIVAFALAAMLPESVRFPVVEAVPSERLEPLEPAPAITKFCVYVFPAPPPLDSSSVPPLAVLMPVVESPFTLFKVTSPPVMVKFPLTEPPEMVNVPAPDLVTEDIFDPIADVRIAFEPDALTSLRARPLADPMMPPAIVCVPVPAPSVIMVEFPVREICPFNTKEPEESVVPRMSAPCPVAPFPLSENDCPYVLLPGLPLGRMNEPLVATLFVVGSEEVELIRNIPPLTRVPPEVFVPERTLFPLSFRMLPGPEIAPDKVIEELFVPFKVRFVP